MEQQQQNCCTTFMFWRRPPVRYFFVALWRGETYRPRRKQNNRGKDDTPAGQEKKSKTNCTNAHMKRRRMVETATHVPSPTNTKTSAETRSWNARLEFEDKGDSSEWR